MRANGDPGKKARTGLATVSMCRDPYDRKAPATG
jgi:hypothetical protein